MSVTGHSNVRHPDDYYRTPAFATRAILRKIDQLHAVPRRILDAGCGDGAILIELSRYWPKAALYGVELDAGRADVARFAVETATVVAGDFLTGDIARHFDLCVMNPPFSLAQQFIERALKHCSVVASLQRQNFSASLERVPFHRAHPSDMYVLPRRPQFAKAVHCVGAGKKPKDGCGWQVMVRVEEPKPRACALCSGKTTANSSDSTEYAWFAFGEGCGGRWGILDIEGTDDDAQGTLVA